MDSIKRRLVQARMSGEFDDDILHRKCFDVNMRLFRDFGSYRSLVLNVTTLMSGVMNQKYDDYSEIKGISGANVGIPFNIIGLHATRSLKPDADSAVLKGSIWFLINPKITDRSKETRIVSSNCGSVCLPKSIKVERHVWVEVEYYSIVGKRTKTKVEGLMALTLQHEVEHNLGILIIDKERKSDEN